MEKRKLTKIATTIGTLGTALYLGAQSVFAEGTPLGNSLCGDGKGPGFPIPGCAGINIGSTIGSVLGIAFFVALIIALAFLILGGIKWIMSGGDKEGTGKAKETVTSALIGLAVVIGAFILINLLLQLLTGKSLNQIAPPQLDTGIPTTVK